MGERAVPKDDPKDVAALRVYQAAELVREAAALLRRAVQNLEPVIGVSRELRWLRCDVNNVNNTRRELDAGKHGALGLMMQEVERLAAERAEYARRKPSIEVQRGTAPHLLARLVYQAGRMAPAAARIDPYRILLADLWTTVRPWRRGSFLDFLAALRLAHEQRAVTLCELQPGEGEEPWAGPRQWNGRPAGMRFQKSDGTFVWFTALNLSLTARSLDSIEACACDVGDHAADCSFWDSIPRELQDETTRTSRDRMGWNKPSAEAANG